jgi:hypothetical protein
MPYLNAPDTNLSATFTPLLGKARGQLSITISREIDRIKDRVLDICTTQDLKTLEELNKLGQKLDSIQKNVISIKSRTTKVRRVITVLTSFVASITAIIILLKIIPIPALRQTTGAILILGDVLHLVKELRKQVQDDITALNNILDSSNSSVPGIPGISQALTSVEFKIRELQLILKSCKETSQIPEIPVENLDQIRSIDFTESEKYTSTTTGITYDLEIIIVDESQIAPLRKAIALDSNRIIRFEGTPSFSSSTDVLLRELKFRIDNNIN